MTGWSKFQQRAYFLNPSPTDGGQGGGYHDQPNYEIFTPPYLCKGRLRPEISSAPQAVAYGQRFTISSPQASGIVSGGRVTLVRLSSVTHCFNMNQRLIELARTSGPTANEITLRVPTNRNYCSPGHYRLFLVDENGTPSHASIIAIDGSVCTSQLTITQSRPNPAENYNACYQTTVFTVSGGPSGSTYDWTVNGANSYGQGPTSVTVYTSTGGAPSAQVTVLLHGSTGCGASSVRTSYFPGCPGTQ